MSNKKEIVIRYDEELLKREVRQLEQMGWKRDGEVTTRTTPLNRTSYKQIMVKE